MNLRLLIALLLCASAALSALQRYHPETTIDFYHYWAFANAKKMTTHAIGDPYSNREGYRNVLRRFGDRYLAEGGDPRFRPVHERRVFVREENGERVDKLLPTGPPLLYATFFFLPVDYIAATKWFQGMQWVAFLVGALLLTRLARLEWILGIALAAFLAQAYQPFVVDVHVGNVNALQFLVTVLLYFLVARVLPEARPGPRRILFGTLFVFLNLWFLLVKPNVLPLTTLLLAHAALRFWREKRFLLLSAGLGLLLSLGSALWSSLYFGSWGAVWLHWLDYIQVGQEGSLLEFPRELGNTSPALFVKDWTGMTIVPAVLSILVFFLVSYAFVEAWRGPRSSERGLLARLIERTRERLLDPGFCVSAGVLVVLSAAPLVWYHYYVLLLVPLYHALSRASRPNLSTGLAILAFLPFLQTANRWLNGVSFDTWAIVTGFTFVVLWLAILLAPIVDETEREEPTEAPVAGG